MKETTAASGFNTDIEATRSNMVGEVSPNGQDSTKRGLKSRHAQMIALGGTIGTVIPSSPPLFPFHHLSPIHLHRATR